MQKIYVKRTSTLSFTHSSPDLPSPNPDHTQPLCLIECAHFLFGFSKNHSVLQFSQLGLRIGLLCFARAVKMQLKIKKGSGRRGI
jgi:hypothetical protein